MNRIDSVAASRPQGGLSVRSVAPARGMVEYSVGAAPSPEGGSLLPVVLSKYWWLLIPILAASSFVAYQAAERFGKRSAVAQAAVIYRGLPGVPGPTIYEPLGPKTCSELMTSVNVLQRVLDKRGVNLPVSVFTELVTVELSRSSSLVNVEFAWEDPAEATSILNDLLDEFIEYVASERRATLREHLQHVEVSLLEAKSEVDLARTAYDTVRRRYHEKIFESGGQTEDFYVGLMATASKTKYAIDEERALSAGMNQQLKVLDEKKQAVTDSLPTLEKETADKLLAETTQRVTTARDKYAEGSTSYRRLTALMKDLSGDDDVTEVGLSDWYAGLLSRLNNGVATLGKKVIDEAALAHEPLLASHAEQVEAIQERVSDIERTQETLQLRLYPMTTQIDVLEDRLGTLKAETQGSGAAFTDFDASRLEEAESALRDAESVQQAIALQQANMRQLEKCRVNEWTVSVPAELDTTSVSTNHTKIGALAFALCTMGLCAPVVLAEWLGRRETNESVFARSLGLPLVAERLMHGVQRLSRGHGGLADLSPSTIEDLRRFSLRIQQSCHRTNRGATVVFSTLDPKLSAVPLMAAIAECLADREERVLLINSVPAERASCWVAPVPVHAGGASDEENHKAGGELATTSGNGLAEYLAAECQELGDLIQPTGIRGVDAILCGNRDLPREAMASSSLTELIDQCSDRYSMILVNGPAMQWATDMQMLASRADGVVLTTSRSVPKGGEAWAAVADLIHIQAPIIGLVS